MTLGTVTEATIGGLYIRTQNDGDVQIKGDGVMVTPIVSGNGDVIFSGEVQAGSVTIPAIVFPDELIQLTKKIKETPNGGHPCTFTLFSGEVWGFDGTVISELKSSLKEGKTDLEFVCKNLRRL